MTPGAAPDGTFGLVSFRGISGLLNNNTVDGGDNTQAFFAEERGRTRLALLVEPRRGAGIPGHDLELFRRVRPRRGRRRQRGHQERHQQVHGAGFYFLRDNKWGATNPFQTQTMLSTASAHVPLKPKDRRQQFGGTVGGPIKKDKLFFFFSFDQQKRNFPGAAVPSNPAAFFAPFSAAELATLAGRGVNAAQANDGLAFMQSLTGVVERTGDQTLLLPKIDWQINNNHSFAVSYNHLRWNSPAGVQTAATVFRGVDNWGNDGVNDDWVIGRFTSVLGRVSRTRCASSGAAISSSRAARPDRRRAGRRPTGRTPDVNITGTAALGSASRTSWNAARIPTSAASTSGTPRRSLGTHLIKFGIDFNRGRHAGQPVPGGRRLHLQQPRRLHQRLRAEHEARRTGARNYFDLRPGHRADRVQFPTIDFAGFIQDTWHVQAAHDAELGPAVRLRADAQSADPEPARAARRACSRATRTTGDRASASNWDVTGKGDTVVRGGYGMFYGRIINSTISNAITNTGMRPASSR